MPDQPWVPCVTCGGPHDRLSKTHPYEPGCSCGKPFPEDGGAEGVCECCSGCKPWKPFDAAVWLLNGRWGCVDVWGVISTPEEWVATLLLNGKQWRVTVEPSSTATEPGR